MSRLSISLLLSALVLVGCTTTSWTKPGGTATEFHRDSDHCTPGGVAGWALSHLNREADFPSYRRCMVSKGWQPTETESWWRRLFW